MADAPYDKAIQETAKTVRKAIPALERFGAFLHKVFGESVEHLGGALSDWAWTYRYENMVRLADRVEQIHRERQIAGKTVYIPPRLGIPLLNGASLESDPTLSEMWAGLVANATDPSRRVQARRTFTQLLSSLEPIDALVLMEIERHGLENLGREQNRANKPEEEYRAQWPALKTISAALKADPHDVALALENLERLGLAFDYMHGGGIPVPLTHPEATISLTATGEALLRACRIDDR